MGKRNIAPNKAQKMVGVTDKTLNEYGDFLQTYFLTYAGGVKRHRNYDIKDIAMLRELKIRRDDRMLDEDIISELFSIFYESTVVVG